LGVGCGGGGGGGGGGGVGEEVWFVKLRKATISFVVLLSVYSAVHLSSCNSSAPAGRIFAKIYTRDLR
jgi:hypothetical protein